VVVPGLLYFASQALTGTPFLFGWAKPVPVNFGNLRHPKRDMVWVAAAGPGANFLMAIGWALLLRFVAPYEELANGNVHKMCEVGVMINLSLMAINLLPIPPLDGGRIAVGLLPNRAAGWLARAEPYGFFVILALIAIPGALWTILGPIYRVFAFLVYALSGL
jgi:Zn-dependent protease